MTRYSIYTLILLALSFIGFCQDIIVKKDSSRITAKVYTISDREIIYSEFDDDTYKTKVKKTEVSKIVFRNGTEIIFNPNPINKQDTSLIMLVKNNRKVKDSLKIGDHIKFNIQIATVVFNSFSNVPRRDYLGMTSSNEYKYASTKQNVTFNVGFNFLFGKNPYVKHVIGANYLKTKGEYYNDYGSIGYSSYARYKTNVDFINVVTGLRFTIFKKLHLEPLIALNIVAKSKTTHSGTETSFDYQTPPYTRYTRTFENESTDPSVGTTISLAPKISYELPVRKIKMEMYVSYNLAYQYRLPWYQFGFLIFPFKKLK